MGKLFITLYANPTPNSQIIHKPEYQFHSILQTFDSRPFTAHWRHDLLLSSTYLLAKR